MTALAQERVCMGDGKHGYRDSGRRSGGLATALALARRGHEPRVYERRPAPATMGAGVTLWPNAGFVLADLELLDEVLALAARPPPCIATTPRAGRWAALISSRWIA